MNKSELPNGKQLAFLSVYSQSGNITQACKVAGVARSMHYEWLNDDDYAAAFATAHAEAADALEAEAWRRAVEGVLEPVIYKGQPARTPVFDADGKVKRDEKGDMITEPVMVRRYDSRLLELKLRAMKPEKYRDNFKGELVTMAGRTGAVDLSGLTDAEIQTLESIARRLQSVAA